MRLAPRPQFVVVWFTLIWGIATVLVLLELARHTNDQIERQANSWANAFNVGWISRPDDYRDVFRTLEVEYFANLRESQRFFREVILTWVHPTRGEVVLYPAEKIGGRVEDLARVRSISLPLRMASDPDRVCGYLHFSLNPWERWGTTVAFLLAAVNVLLLILILFYLLTRISRRYEASQSELERKKQELIQLEQLALAGRLSAGLLHDLKKPVIHIREECVESTSGHPLKDIREQSELFLSMLRDSGLEGFAKRRSTEPECCDVIDLVERSLRLVEYEREDVEVEVRVEGEVPFVWAHPTRLMQVLSNLILNAYQAMRGRGKLTVRILSEEEGETRNAVVLMEDTGPGVSPENRDRIFDPFFTTGKDGSGLGLYIIRTILEDQGGRVTVGDSAEGGASFRVVLPEGG